MSLIHGKRIVITGATSGIGREAATRLASLGAHVVLACRDTVRGEQVADDVRARSGTESAAVMELGTIRVRSARSAPPIAARMTLSMSW
jgi:NAD(P)-dependent dehydrogenase (short-subunit alcohol dehydrogenase family)